MTKHEPADWIPLPEAALLADVTDRWMRSLVQGGRVVGLKVGRNYIVSRASAAAYVRSETEGRPRATKPKRAARRKR
jgi:hypothetical protein